MSHTILPNTATVHKRVNIKMEDKSRPPHKFTDLCHKFMWLKLLHEDEFFKFSPMRLYQLYQDINRDVQLLPTTLITRRWQPWSRKSEVMLLHGFLVTGKM
jgi:hypothetical protein